MSRQPEKPQTIASLTEAAALAERTDFTSNCSSQEAYADMLTRTERRLDELDKTQLAVINPGRSSRDHSIQSDDPPVYSNSYSSSRSPSLTVPRRPSGHSTTSTSRDSYPSQSCPRVGWTRGSGRVGSGRVGSGRVTILPDFGGSGRVGSALRIFSSLLIISWYLNRCESLNTTFGLIDFLR